MNDNKAYVTGKRLIGYVRVENRDNLFTTEQNSRIEAFSQREAFDVVQIEHEVSNGATIVRTGLWKTLRLMTCIHCEPKQMPMSAEYDYWFREAIRPCNCKNPEPVSGILVDNIKILCANPPLGAKLILDMCVAKKHIYSVNDKSCLSCCNPQAVAFVKRQMLGN